MYGADEDRRRGGACLGLLAASAVSGLLWAALVIALVVWC